MRPAVFLDRDGVINEIVFNEDTEQMDSPFKAEDFIFTYRAQEALRTLKKAGFFIFVVTNQPAAAKGKTSIESIEAVNAYMLDRVGREYIDEVYTCFHFPRRTTLTKLDFLICDCDCRKPKPGLLLRAREKYMIDWANSYMVGDSYTDVIAGKRAGVKAVFVGNYKCDICRMLGEERPDLIVESLYQFSEQIIREAKI